MRLFALALFITKENKWWKDCPLIQNVEIGVMADNFLERHYEEYEARKAAYLRKKQHLPIIKHHLPERPEDDAL